MSFKSKQKQNYNLIVSNPKSKRKRKFNNKNPKINCIRTIDVVHESTKTTVKFEFIQTKTRGNKKSNQQAKNLKKKIYLIAWKLPFYY